MILETTKCQWRHWYKYTQISISTSWFSFAFILRYYALSFNKKLYYRVENYRHFDILGIRSIDGYYITNSLLNRKYEKKNKLWYKNVQMFIRFGHEKKTYTRWGDLETPNYVYLLPQYPVIFFDISAKDIMYIY